MLSDRFCVHRYGLGHNAAVARVFSDRPRQGTPDSELRVLDAFRLLDDDWWVFHSVRWQALRRGRQGDGEADFVVMHADYGVVVLEVKGGGIDVVAGRWTSTDRHGAVHKIKNPFEQAKDSKYALLAYMDNATGGAAPTCHAVVFTDGTVIDDIGPDGPRGIVLDRADLAKPEKALVRVFAHWEQRAALTAKWMRRVAELLAPTVSIRSRLRDRVAQAEAELLTLTEQQIAAFRMLRTVRRCVVLGGAGTGKTVLAVERARQLAQEGARVLLTCFNAPLGEHLRRVADFDGVTVQTFHSFCLEHIRSAGKEIPRNPDASWWETSAPELLVDAATAGISPAYDALVVDEGQDFHESWLTVLQMLLSEPDDSPIGVFGDPHQEIYGRSVAFPASWPRVPLDVNCRNTLPIARKVAAVFADSQPIAGAEGQAPKFVEVKSDREAMEATRRNVIRMLEGGGLKPAQVVVLAARRAVVDALRQELAGDVPFTTLDGVGVAVETIQRFKGLEAEVAVVVLPTTGWEQDELRRLAYVGFSRARSFLMVVATPKARKALGW